MLSNGMKFINKVATCSNEKSNHRSKEKKIATNERTPRSILIFPKKRNIASHWSQFAQTHAKSTWGEAISVKDFDKYFFIMKLQKERIFT